MARRRKPELVHGLTETVELADWDFAIIISALKLYARAKKRAGDAGHYTYARNLAKELRRPFSRLVRRTKRKHREILASISHAQLDDFQPEGR